MPPVVTYDGVPSRQGGNLFDGIKFWVAQRVPDRSGLISSITSNGGAITRLEKEANICIADRVRRDCPPGSISWEFVVDSVKKGVLQNKENYETDRPAGSVRPIASGQPSKGTRQKFTPEEDAILIAAVLANSKHRSGNELYQNLEAKYPSHPWQSWRNRWVKSLQLLPKERLKRAAQLAPDDVVEVTAEDENSEPEDSIPAPREAESRTTPVHVSTILRGRSPVRELPGFTPSDIEALVQFVRRSVNQGKKWNDAKIYKDLATEQPQHTWQDWKTQFQARWRARKIDMESWNEASQIEEPRERRRETTHVPLTKTRTSTPSSETESRRAVSLPDQRNSPDPIAQSPKIPIESPNSDDEYSPIPKHRLDHFMSLYSQNHPRPPMHYRVGGHDFELWDLFHAVDKQDSAPPDVNWPRVAEDLGFSSPQAQKILLELSACWDKNLEGFFHFLTQFDEWCANTEKNDLLPEVDHQLDEIPAVPPSPSSPAKARLQARGPSPILTDPAISMTPARKRKRQDVEVPSTPPDGGRTGLASTGTHVTQTPMTNKKRRLVEPQTQDFAFKKTIDAFEEYSEDHGLSPSQRRCSQYDRQLDSPTPVSSDQRRGTSQSKPPDRRSPSNGIPPSAPPAAKRRKLPNDLASDTASKPSSSATNPAVQPISQTSTTSVPISAAPRSARDSPELTQRQTQQSPLVSTEDPPVDEEDEYYELRQSVKHYESLGFDRDTILDAFYRTTLVVGGLSKLVMENLREGNPVPMHHEGIWTTRDDESLRFIDEVAQEKGEPTSLTAMYRRTKARKETARLEKKQGRERMDSRRKFLKIAMHDEWFSRFK